MAEFTNEQLDEQRETVDTFFLSVKTFESELFMANSELEFREAMERAAGAIMNYASAKKTVDFRELDSYDHFRIEGVILALRDIMQEEVDYLIVEEAGFSPIIVEEVKKDSAKQAFLLNQAKEYFVKYQAIFKDAIADNYFGVIEEATSASTISRAAKEVITGTSRYMPVFMNPNGSPIASREDQIFMRLKQARIAKDKEIVSLEEDVERLTKQIHGMQLNIETVKKAQTLTLEFLESKGAEWLREAVINEDGEHTERKRLMQFLPAGELALYAADQMDRGRRNARNEIAKAEFKRATDFYENCNINNTPKELANKILIFQADLPTKKEALIKVQNRLAESRAKKITDYDESLKKMRQAFIQNIGKTRV